MSVDSNPPASIPDDALRATSPAPAATAAGRSLAVLRVLLGAVFTWAFLDKALGLGFATPADAAWVRGGSPTSGFLASREGTFGAVFRGMAGQAWVDWLFMAGMLLVGVALLLGIALRLAAIGATCLMGTLWLASLPLENNPVVDEHVICAAAAWVLALAGAGRTFGAADRVAGLVGPRAARWLG